MKYSTLFLAAYLMMIPFTSFGHGNNYFFDEDSGYFELLATDFRNKNFWGGIYFIDFKGEKIRKVGDVGGVVNAIFVSPNRKYIAYSGDSDLFIRSLPDEKIIFHSEKMFDIPYWSSDSRLVMAGRIVYDVIKNESYDIAKDADYVVHYGWRDECGCFLYEQPDSKLVERRGYVPSEGSTLWSFDVKNGERLYNGKAKRFQGPDNLYLTTIPSVDAEYATVTLHGLQEWQREIEFYSTGRLFGILRPIWGEGVFRIYGRPYSTFDYVKEKFVSNLGSQDFFLSYDSPLYKDPSIDDRERASNRPRRRDIGVSNERYVLMWNKDEKRFEVEDINTGEIAKIYKKFW